MKNKGFLSNIYVRNILRFVVLLLAFIVIVNLLLHVGTHHGKEIITPDFSLMTVEEARLKASEVGVRVYVGDSVCVPRMRSGGVFRQTPHAGAKVKKGRRIMLVANVRVPRKVVVPNVVGYSMRQAKGELISRGLKVGKLIYRHDIATNNVIGQHWRGVEILPGETVDTGSEIDLVLGLNAEDCATSVPNLTGKDYIRALDIIQDHYLNEGRVSFDASVRNYTDSIRAVVFHQSPAPGPSTMGATVSIRLTVDHSRLEPEAR